MLRRFQAMLLAMALITVGMPTIAMGAEPAQSQLVEQMREYVPGEAIVIVKGEDSDTITNEKLASIGDELYEVQDLMTISGAADSSKDSNQDDAVSNDPLNGLAETEEIKLVKSSTLDTMELIEELNKCPDVLVAEPNYIAEIAATPDYTSQQYGMNGEFGIDVPNWNDQTAPKNADNILVAVMDSGVDYLHEDLRDTIWKDGEKYPELVAYGGGMYGYNAVAKVGHEVNFATSDPMDEHSHGTHCAGIIAGQWNDFGVSGVANGPKIMAVKGLGANGQGAISSLVDGLNYIKIAMDAGVNVKVVSNSWGVHGISKAITSAVREIASRGAVVTFASTNDGMNAEETPELYDGFRSIPNVVVVNATDKNGDYAWFSDYGRNVTDVAAPGVDIMSTVPRAKANASPEYSRKLLFNDFDGNNNSFTDYVAGDENTTVSEVNGYSGKALQLESYAKNSKAKLVFRGIDASLYRPEYLTYHVGAKMGTVQTGVTIKDGLGKETKLLEANITPIESNLGACSIKLPELDDYTNVEVTVYFATIDETQHQFVLDDIIMTNDAVAYALKSGTSMATPAVAGEAAVLMAQFPNDSAEKIAARIIGSVKRNDAHKDKCISGGIANLSYALAGKTAPVLFAAETSKNFTPKEDDMVKISGYFFGDEVGTVTIDGENMAVKNWSDTEITVAMPKAFQYGCNTIEVTKPSGTEGLLNGHRQFFLTMPITPSYQMLDASAINSFAPDTMIALNGRIYVSMSNEMDVGGVTALYEYDPAVEKFRKLAQLDDTQLASNLIAMNGHVLMMVVDGQYKKPTHLLIDYNPFEDNLRQTQMRFADEELVGITLVDEKGKLLLTGGMRNQLNMNIYEINPETGETQKVGKLARPRVQAGTFCYNGENYLAYGMDETLKASYRIEKIIQIEDGTYTTEPVIESARPEGVGVSLSSEMSVVSYENGAMITGFCKMSPDGTLLADTYHLNFTETGYEFVEDPNLFSKTRLSYLRAVICEGKYYILTRLHSVETDLLFGSRGSVSDVKTPGDRLPVTTKTVGDLAVSYNADVVFTGAAIKAPELEIKVTDVKTNKEYAISSINYKNNKNVGTATFTIKALKADGSLKKALSKTPMTFAITKARLTNDNTDVKINKKGKITKVQYVVETTNKKGKIKLKKYTVPKKDYVVENDERIVLKDSSKNYKGEFDIYYVPCPRVPNPD